MSKLKDKVVGRTYDEDGFLKRAACICVNETETRVLLVSSSKDSQLWIVPGGGVEPDELPDMAAIREVREEAGVCGSLGRCLGIFENTARGHRTSVYVLVVTEEMDEWEEAKKIGRKRKWFSVEEAVNQLSKHKPVQSNYVRLLLPVPNKNATASDSLISVTPETYKQVSEDILAASSSSQSGNGGSNPSQEKLHQLTAKSCSDTDLDGPEVESSVLNKTAAANSIFTCHGSHDNTRTEKQERSTDSSDSCRSSKSSSGCNAVSKKSSLISPESHDAGN